MPPRPDKAARVRRGTRFVLLCFLCAAALVLRAAPVRAADSRDALYAEAVYNYADIAYMLHRDLYRAALRLRETARTFVSAPAPDGYIALIADLARAHGAFMRTLPVYYDDAAALRIRERLLPKGEEATLPGAPFTALFLPEEPRERPKRYRNIPPPPQNITREHLLAYRLAPGENGPPVSAASAVEGLRAARAALTAQTLSPEMFLSIGRYAELRRIYIDGVTALIAEDSRYLLDMYRPATDNTAARLQALPPAQALRALTAAAATFCRKAAQTPYLLTADSLRFGDAVNAVAGVRAAVTGKYGHISGPGFAAAALTRGQDSAGFLNFALSNLTQSARHISEQEAAGAKPAALQAAKESLKEHWPGMAEALGFLEAER